MSTAGLVFVVCAACCVVGHAGILHSVVRTRSAAASRPPGVPRPRLFVEIVWALVPAVALAILLTATWARVRDRTTPKPDVLMKVAR